MVKTSDLSTMGFRGLISRHNVQAGNSGEAAI